MRAALMGAPEPDPATTMTRLAIPAFAAILLSLASFAGFAHDYKAGKLTIDHPWSRAAPDGAQTLGGYMSIENASSEADRLVAVTSDAAERVEIHEMTMEGEVMRMRPLPDGLEIDARMTVNLRPGGYHVMFIEPARDFAVGEKIPAVLEFERAGRVEVEFHVEAMGAAGHEHEDGHDHHDHGEGQ